MTKDNQPDDLIDSALDSVQNTSWLKKVVFGIALFCLASSFLGLFFLIKRIILPGGFN